MTREKIINLAREFSYQHNDATASLLNNHLEAFYHKAQAEAFEAAANRCNETIEIADRWDGGTTTVHKYFYRDDCIAAIREMAKEMK